MIYAKSGIKTKDINDLCPENDKIYKIKTRPVEKYKAQHANIEKQAGAELYQAQISLS